LRNGERGTVSLADNLRNVSCLMKTNLYKALFLTCVFACLAVPAEAADRIRAGQWVGSTTMTGGRTRPSSSCMTQSDADAMNGDVKSVRAYLEKTIPPSICKLSDIKLNGGQVVYTSVCNGGAPNVVTTNYRGDSFEGTSTGGVKTEAKLVGACK
jgi:hypothetical protein